MAHIRSSLSWRLGGGFTHEGESLPPCGEGPAVDIEPILFLHGAFLADGEKSIAKTGLGQNEQVAVIAPPVRENGTIDGSSREVLGIASPDGLKEEVMGGGTVGAGSNESDPLAIG